MSFCIHLIISQSILYNICRQHSLQDFNRGPLHGSLSLFKSGWNRFPVYFQWRGSLLAKIIHSLRSFGNNPRIFFMIYIRFRALYSSILPVLPRGRSAPKHFAVSVGYSLFSSFQMVDSACELNIISFFWTLNSLWYPSAWIRNALSEPKMF